MAKEEDDALDGFKGNSGLRKATVLVDDGDRFWVSGMNNDTAEVEAICDLKRLLLIKGLMVKASMPKQFEI